MQENLSDGTAEALREMDRCKVKKAVALKPGTPAEAVLPYLEQLDMVLVMTVEPGFGGQTFHQEQLAVIRRVRELIDEHVLACDLEVDGGINSTTARQAVAAGANVLVAGTFVYGASDAEQEIQSLRAGVA